MAKRKEKANVKYAWRLGARLPVKAEVAIPILERIREQNDGRLTPTSVLEAARDEASPLHKAFEWDDSIAAEKHRLSQASVLIVSARVTVASARGESAPVRAFVSVVQEEDDACTYTSTIVAMQDSSMRSQVIAKAKEDLIAWRKRYNNLQEFASLFEVIDAAIEAA